MVETMVAVGVAAGGAIVLFGRGFVYELHAPRTSDNVIRTAILLLILIAWCVVLGLDRLAGMLI